MSKATRITVQRKTAPRVRRTPDELAELRAVRDRFQRDKPTLEQILASTGQAEATTLGDYIQARKLLHALGQERERQQVTLAQLAERTGFDPAVLSRLFTGRQSNPTLATVGRIAHALGKAVIHTLCDLPRSGRMAGPANGGKSAPRGKASGRKRHAAAQRAPSVG